MKCLLYAFSSFTILLFALLTLSDFTMSSRDKITNHSYKLIINHQLEQSMHTQVPFTDRILQIKCYFPSATDILQVTIGDVSARSPNNNSSYGHYKATISDRQFQTSIFFKTPDFFLVLCLFCVFGFVFLFLHIQKELSFYNLPIRTLLETTHFWKENLCCELISLSPVISQCL